MRTFIQWAHDHLPYEVWATLTSHRELVVIGAMLLTYAAVQMTLQRCLAARRRRAIEALPNVSQASGGGHTMPLNPSNRREYEMITKNTRVTGSLHDQQISGVVEMEYTPENLPPAAYVRLDTGGIALISLNQLTEVASPQQS